MSTPSPPPTSAVSATPANARLPSDSTLRQAAKIGIVEDRPIMMDYWSGSLEKSVMIGVKNDETKEKMLVRNAEEYTSPIQKIFKVEQEYIILTENSIYLVDVAIPTRSISG